MYLVFIRHQLCFLCRYCQTMSRYYLIYTKLSENCKGTKLSQKK
jgi:hypothetical protein